MNYRDAILEGAKEARRLHEKLGIEESTKRCGGRINVFEAARNQKAFVMFRRLSGLLGAFLKEGDNAGIMVTTERRLAVQRFTGAHELGHLVMGHEPSLDYETTLSCSSIDLPIPEIEANAFAAEFLSPRWLLAYHASRQGWNSVSMTDPVCVYQLSLRIGLSYDATCRSLLMHKLISSVEMKNLVAVTPKLIKKSILPAGHEPESWHCDVWLLQEGDHGADLEGHPDDLFVMRLREKSGAGYLWQKDQLCAEGFQIIAETRTAISQGAEVGSDTTYSLATGPAPTLLGEIRLRQHRPWESLPPLTEIGCQYDVQGKEKGMSRAERQHALAA
jgi:Zn-dependent peptidase ImmA (M78 family)